MQLTAPRLGPIERTATAFRLLTMGLAALAVGLSNQPSDPRMLLLGAGYAAFSGLLWLLAPRLSRSWLVYPIALVDVGAVTALVSLALPGAPLWALYLFPIAAAAPVGRVPAALTGGLSVLAYLGASWLATGVVSPFALWPIVLVGAATFVLATVTARWFGEQQERRAWQEVAAAARALIRSGEPDDIATVVAERARRLVPAEWAGLWWCEGADQLRPGPQAGPASGQPRVPGTLLPALAGKLDRRPVPLAELGEQPANLGGEASMLRHDGVRSALLVVTWHRSPRDRAAGRERLRVFASWAADALAQAQTRVIARELARREDVLRHVATKLAATLDRQVVQDAAIEATRSGLRAAVSLVERPSGRVLVGDVEVAETLVRLAVDGEAPAFDAGAPVREARQPDAPLVGLLGPGLALLAWRADPRLDEADATWLEELTALARAAMARCATHEQLLVEEQRLRASLEALPAPLTLWDASGTLVFANAGYRALALDGLPPSGLLSAGPREDEVTLGDPPRTFVVITSPVAQGQYVVSLYREITREREALRAKDELISMVGHELRTPLASIHGYSQLMARQLGVVQMQVNQLNRLIGDFMDASRLDGGQLPLTRQPVDVAELARAAVERFRGAREGRALRLDLADVPPVDGDPTRLGQVLDNLLTNAAKYSPADTEIVLAVRPDHEQVLLSVQDYGAGIAPEYLPRLFDRLFRVPGADTEHAGGFGLGLSIVRDLVAAHGGRVWAESAGLGQGSTFWVALPASRGAGTRPLQAAEASPG